MSRLSINIMPPNERAQLARRIEEYVTPEIIQEHLDAIRLGMHDDPVGFLSFHRRYIGGLEVFLLQLGYLRWVPLPMWDPREPIPQEFNIPNSGPGRLRDLNPNISFSPQFDNENLADFSTVEELGEALRNRHNEVHRRIGGIMNDLRRAPEAPIFWPFHSFIDDIWWKWQRIMGIPV